MGTASRYTTTLFRYTIRMEMESLMMDTKHIEYHFKAETSDTVIVFIHGIQGSPLQFDYMTEKLSGRYSIENLLLPGHGKTASDFGNSNMAEWQNYVDERIIKLQQEYKNIILVGHSMGGLLSVQSAISYPQKIRGLFLIALPLCIHISYPCIKNSFSIAFSKKDRNDIIAAARKGNSISASNPFEYLAGTPRYIELLKKSKSTRALLEKLQLPIVIVHSANDELVSNKSLNYSKDRGNIQVITLNDSGHYYYSRAAQEKISDTLKEFIAEKLSVSN